MLFGELKVFIIVFKRNIKEMVLNIVIGFSKIRRDIRFGEKVKGNF